MRSDRRHGGITHRGPNRTRTSARRRPRRAGSQPGNVTSQRLLPSGRAAGAVDSRFLRAHQPHPTVYPASSTAALTTEKHNRGRYEEPERPVEDARPGQNRLNTGTEQSRTKGEQRRTLNGRKKQQPQPRNRPSRAAGAETRQLPSQTTVQAKDNRGICRVRTPPRKRPAARPTLASPSLKARHEQKSPVSSLRAHAVSTRPHDRANAGPPCGCSRDARWPRNKEESVRSAVSTRTIGASLGTALGRAVVPCFPETFASLRRDGGPTLAIGRSRRRGEKAQYLSRTKIRSCVHVGSQCHAREVETGSYE